MRMGGGAIRWQDTDLKGGISLGEKATKRKAKSWTSSPAAHKMFKVQLPQGSAATQINVISCAM